MNLIVIGISHKTASVKIREKFSFGKKRLEESYAGLKNSGLVSGAVILSTCNRTEIYAYATEDYSFPQIKEFIFNLYQADEDERARYLYVLEGHCAITHLFRVVSGLESQVLGENQILTQVSDAWATAQEMLSVDSFIDELFAAARKIGKKIRRETKISQGNISIGSVAIKRLEDKIGSLQERSVLIIGTGKVGTLMSSYLKEKNIKGIFVASRTYARAQELAARCCARAVDFTHLEEELKNIDIVISSTSSSHLILKKEMLVKLMQDRSKPLLIMDLAVPRDVDPAAREIPRITLFDLDDLKYVVEENYKLRQKEALSAEGLIKEQVNKFLIQTKGGEEKCLENAVVKAR